MTKTNEATNEIKQALTEATEMVKANRLKLTVKLGELPNRKLVNGKGSKKVSK
jgi:hypothetical protein